jgi:hypothetical protein
VSYGQHQEQVARTLHELICHPQPAGDEETAGVVVACRDQAIKALRERLTYLAGGNEQTDERPAVTLGSLTTRPVRHLMQVLDTLPQPAVPDVAPSRLLPGPDAAAADATTDRWRCLARNLLLGTAELTRADHQPWLSAPEAGWHLAGDAASTIEALLVLDNTLAAAGHLDPGHERTRLTHRLVAEHVTRLAGWFGNDHGPDSATTGVRHDLGVGGSPPVTLVRHAADYATAQRTLTALLHGHATLIRPGTDQLPGLAAARALATGQIRLAQAFAGWAEHTGDPGLAEQFRSRIPDWRSLHVSTTRLAEVEKRRSPLLLAQQSEMVIRLRSTRAARLSVHQLHDLNAATHELAVTVGRTLRHEALATRNIVALDTDHLGPPRAQPMTGTEWAFTAACQRLADRPPPPSHEQQVVADERERLRRILEEIVIGTPPPLRQMRPSLTTGPMPPGRHRSPGPRPSL